MHRTSPTKDHFSEIRNCKLTYHIDKNKKNKLGKIRQQRNMFPMKEQDKTPEKDLSEVEISNLLNKKFKVMIVKKFKQLGRLDEQSKKLEVFNKEKT